MKKREIPRNIEWQADLSDDVLAKITQLCFLPNIQQIPKAIDILFIFGTSDSFPSIREIVKNLVSIAIIKNIVVTGGLVSYSDTETADKPESHLIWENIRDTISTETNIFIEDKSANTLDNILFALPYIRSIKKDNLLFITKSFHSRRAYLTLKKSLTNIQLFSYSYDAYFANANIPLTKDNWWLHDKFKQRILGEVARIMTYGSRGDIYYPAEVEELIHSIHAKSAV